MKAKFFILSWVSYTHSDDFMCTNTETFTDEQEARREFERGCRDARKECQWGSAWDDIDNMTDEERGEQYEYNVEESSDTNDYTVGSEAYGGYKVQVTLREKEIDIPLPSHLPEPILNIGDTFRWQLDNMGDIRTSEVMGVELRSELDLDGTPMTNSAYLVNNAVEQDRLWVYESEIIND